LIQEEIGRNTRDGSSSKDEDEENCTSEGKEKKGKGNSSNSKSNSCQGGKKKDMSKIKCFHCHKLGNFSTKCPHKKVVNNPSRGSAGEAICS